MDTYGFDYVSAIFIDILNIALKANLSELDLHFTCDTIDKDTGDHVSLDVKFSPWQIVTGGSNKLVNINLPIATGALAISGVLSKTFDLSNVSVIVQVTMTWLSDQSGGSIGAGAQTKLALSPSTTNNPNDAGYVAAIAVLDPGKKLTDLGVGLLKATFPLALIENKDKLQYVFASVNPQPSNLSIWLRPVKWQYFYLDAPKPALCFLCMMSDAPFPTSAFDSSAFVDGNDCTVLISQNQFFQHVVMPGVTAAYSGASFTQSSAGDVATIRNNGNFSIGSVQAHSLVVTTSLQGNGLRTQASGGGPLSFLFGLANLPNASYSWGLDATNALVFANGTVTFQRDPNPAITQNSEIHWYDWVLLAVTGVVNIAGLVAAIYDTIDGFHNQVDAIGTDTINAQVQASTGGTLVNLNTIFDWKLGSRSFSPNTAGLAGPFFVSGNFR